MSKHRQRKDVVEQYFNQNLTRPSKLTEQDLILHPAVYNQEGLMGDFESYFLIDGDIFSLSGRVGPYLSIPDWFNGAGQEIIREDPDYVSWPSCIQTTNTNENQER